MIKLYIDFDGVILDTIDVSYKEILNSKIDLNDNDKVQEVYNTMGWGKLINKSKPINDSINCIKKLIDSKLYDVTILTHVISNDEIRVKDKFLRDNFDEIDVIYVNKKHDKCDVVDCYNTVLVDDYMDNLGKWEAKGGIPVKFSTTDKQYDCIYINKLDLLIDKYDEIKKKMTASMKKSLV